jgi:LysM repeat protein
VNSLQKFTIFLVLAAVFSSGKLASEELIHVVGKGETVYSISRFYRVGPEELMKANGITDPSKLQVGKKLIIPSSAFSDINVTTAETTSVSSVTAVPDPVSAQIPTNDYKVAKGDTLYSIAKKHGISLQVLQDVNKFAHNHVIKAGDVIKVPGKIAPTVTAQSKPAGNSSRTDSPAAGILSMRWPVTPKEIAYMTGQMGVVVQGEHNEPVKSLIQGKVISAGPWRKFGKVAIVEAAGGYFYMYGGCESLSVKVGDKISAGTELGKLGINAVSEKPQLFFMVFRSDVPIDPAKAPRAGGNVKI